MNTFRFRIPFKKPIVLKGQEHAVREGVLLEQGGQWAEASPLPGFSSENIDDVVAAVRGEQPAPPALQFALQSLKAPINEPIKVPWNGLLLGNRKQVLAATDNFVQSHCRTAKLKVGRNELQADITLVKEVRKRLPDHVRLRLDANQAWLFEDAVTFFQGIEGVDLEYVEEPLQDPQLLETLFSKTGAKYAVVRVAQLAAQYSPELAAGLDTLDWLSEDLLVDSPQKRGEMFVVASAPTVDANRLEAIQ